MKDMTSLQRCLAILNGEIPDMLPVIPQSFMFAVETAGMKIGDVNKNGKKMAQAHIISQEKYGYDGCVIDFDDATIAEAVGAKVIFREDEPATVDESCPVLKDLRDVYDMPIPDPLSSGRLCDWRPCVCYGACGSRAFQYRLFVTGYYTVYDGFADGGSKVNRRCFGVLPYDQRCFC